MRTLGFACNGVARVSGIFRPAEYVNLTPFVVASQPAIADPAVHAGPHDIV
jgi:hypothetical protein